MGLKDRITMGMMGIGIIALTVAGILGIVYGITVVVKWAWTG